MKNAKNELKSGQNLFLRYNFVTETPRTKTFGVLGLSWIDGGAKWIKTNSNFFGAVTKYCGLDIVRLKKYSLLITKEKAL